MLLANTAYFVRSRYFYLGVIQKNYEANLLSSKDENMTFYWSDPVLF